MLTIPGVYINGEIHLLEPIPFKKEAKVLVTVLEEIDQENESVPVDLFDDLIGVISENTDGSENHDKFMYAKD